MLRGRARIQRAAVALGTGAVEDYLALLLKFIQLRVWVGERR